MLNAANGDRFEVDKIRLQLIACKYLKRPKLWQHTKVWTQKHYIAVLHQDIAVLLACLFACRQTHSTKYSKERVFLTLNCQSNTKLPSFAVPLTGIGKVPSIVRGVKR